MSGGADHPSPSVALVETSELLPGLLPVQSWDVLGTADQVLVRDVAAHPAATHLHLAGLDLTTLEPAALERGDLDLTRPGAPEDRRLAKALVARAVDTGRAVYLLGPEDDRLAAALAGMAAEHDLEIELVFLTPLPVGLELLGLVSVLQQLRDPDGGCPWDLEQDHQSLLPYLVEEAYELIEAVEVGDDADLQEELGDVLLQVVFHAQVARDRAAFGIDQVARAITDKLRRRHPHVFADGDADTAEEVQRNWDRLKAEEKERTGPFDGVPAAGPGLELLHTLQRRAARRGLTPPDLRGDLAGITAAVEVATAADPAHREAAVGAALAAVVAWSRELGVDPEVAARAAARDQRTRTDAALEHGRGEVDDAAADAADADAPSPETWQRWWRSAGDAGS